jgi:hypothetical protein
MLVFIILNEFLGIPCSSVKEIDNAYTPFFLKITLIDYPLFPIRNLIPSSLLSMPHTRMKTLPKY